MCLLPPFPLTTPCTIYDLQSVHTLKLYGKFDLICFATLVLPPLHNLLFAGQSVLWSFCKLLRVPLEG